VIHEFGHLLGLIDNGAPMLTERRMPEGRDPCFCHSANVQSVMYPWTNNDAALRDGLLETEELPYRFDNNDLAGLAAARNIGLNLYSEAVP
jgi:hypothetical protein